MEEWQIQLIEERNTLSSNLVKLNRLIDTDGSFAHLPRPEQRLLIEQRHVMDNYRDVLDRRILRFTDTDQHNKQADLVFEGAQELPDRSEKSSPK